MNDDRSRPTGPTRLDVDADVFADVVDARGAEHVKELVSNVIANVGLLMGTLSVSRGATALDAIRGEAHHLNRVCRSLGFTGIGAICARIEGDAQERIDHLFPTYADDLAHQRQALIEWWSADPVTRAKRR